MDLTEIIGMDEKTANLLKKEGIATVEDLLPLTRYKMEKLAEKTGIDVKIIDTFQNIPEGKYRVPDLIKSPLRSI